jgi:hypothetical protein
VKVTVHFFKASGKWYTTEVVELPADAKPWEFDLFLPGKRLTELHAVTESATPWGYPSMSTGGSLRLGKSA